LNKKYMEVNMPLIKGMPKLEGINCGDTKRLKNNSILFKKLNSFRKNLLVYPYLSLDNISERKTKNGFYNFFYRFKCDIIPMPSMEKEKILNLYSLTRKIIERAEYANISETQMGDYCYIEILGRIKLNLYDFIIETEFDRILKDGVRNGINGKKNRKNIKSKLGKIH